MSLPVNGSPSGAVVPTDAEIIVIGSGAGGAITATLLAEAGHDVLVVEEGDWVEQGTVAPFSLEQMDRQYRAGGVTVALGRPSIAYTEGRCAGGGTEINSGLYRRPPAELMARWADEFEIRDFDVDEVLGLADEVERDLGVGPLPGPAGAASEVLHRGADRLGWRNDESPRWMTYPQGADGPAVRQSMTRTYLPRAMAAGARLVLGHRAERIEHDGASATALVLHGPAGVRRVRTRAVFVCGGAIQTPALLQRSRISGYIGRSLAVHPTVKLTGLFPDEVNAPDDVPVHQVKEFAPDLSFGGSASHPGLLALALSDHWSAFAPALAEWRRASVYYAAITSEGRGWVQALPRVREPLVTYRLTRGDREMLRSGMARLALLLLEAGAQEVYPSFRNAPVVRNRADLAAMQDRFAITKASVMTVHLCSTVPMGERAGVTGAASDGRVHGMANVWVNDASLLPTAPGVNPQATVMAIAARNANRFLARASRPGAAPVGQR